MSLYEFVVPVLSTAGPAGLAYVAMRFGPDAMLRLMAGTVAIVTRDKDRGDRCLEVLRLLRGRAAPEHPPCGHGAATCELSGPPAASGPQPPPRLLRERVDLHAFNLTLTSSAGILQNPTNPTDGQVIRFRVTQGGAGGFTLAYDFGAAGAPALSSAAGKVDILAFEYVASIAKWCFLGSALGN
jgi:hypothetical protein